MATNRILTGITGLDEILCGGLISKRNYLVRGGPGSGKTTLGLHFLTAGAANGEQTLFITLEESEESIRANAQALGFNLDGISFLDFSPSSDFFSNDRVYDIFSPSEVERKPTTQKIVEMVETVKPSRIFLDPLTQFRYLTTDSFQFRKQVLSFLRFLVDRNVTLLFTSESNEEVPDNDLQFMCNGVINLDSSSQGRTIRVTKFRGSNFMPGSHSMRLCEKGIEVFPALMPEIHRRKFDMEIVSSGVQELDSMLHGGLERGTISIFSGPSGVGKTTLGLQFMTAAANRGERAAVYSFEEEVEIILGRCDSINISARSMVERDLLKLVKIEPLRYSPNEFAHMVRHDVEERGIRYVTIDSVSGYRLSLRNEQMISNLHALSKYLQNMGVVVILIVEVENIISEFRVTEVGISYLADNIIFLRYLELEGEMRKAIGILKKRVSDFEKALREIEITREGIKVGRPLTHLRGILMGTPESIE